ncbi:tetratricopeptide repeat protein [Acetobacter sp. TBRC 12305]|uniref:Tetratricopeptide repeat protein n=1 Tax=Acetobacter garciniae TaxID=2817435 RepID=A0A939HLA0_9PROT|nr:type VI secretion system accessory protein TagJ [Acetobacter garciniae]MBO1326518.1 tetratricopeptide repeat protein [Acetobacter garciniae]MBX0346166.1 tetratricopeptide repeat protein [Acetobacter garciniae]
MSDTASSTAPLSAAALLRAGRLNDAIAAATAAVRATPTDIGQRVLLAELLLFSGNLERADVILDAAGQIDPSAAVVISEFRQLLRAETARRQVLGEGRVPDILDTLAPDGQASLAALAALRANDLTDAARHVAEAETLRPRVAGEANDTRFDDFRDVDDLLPGYIETLTVTGKYFWIPLSRIESMIFHPPKRQRDLFWRRCSMSVHAGPDGDVYVPALYYTQGETDDAHRLGRATSWREECGIVRGVGQRLFLIGESDYPIMDLHTVALDTPA